MVVQTDRTPYSKQSENVEKIEEIFDNRPQLEMFPLVVGVGEKQRVFFLPKDYLMGIMPFFRGALGNDWFVEGRNNKVMLPEDDIYLWKMAIEYLYTMDFYPRMKWSQVQCPRRGPYRHGTYGPHDIREPRNCCLTLEIPLYTINRNGSQELYEHRDVRIGEWTTTEVTHFLFDRVVRLFCMAEKYGWTELMDQCIMKIDCFPIGLRALATLQKNCGSLGIGPHHPPTSSKAGLLRLLNDAYTFHQHIHEGAQTKKKES